MQGLKLFRILDANFNRCREGLRVSEEVARFVLGDKRLTASLKKARHAVTAAMRRVPQKNLLEGRNVRADVGREPSELKSIRADMAGLFAANIQRSKESLRVLEETVKLVEPLLASRFKKIRFQVYAIEKRALKSLEALRDHSQLKPPGPAARKSGSGGHRRGRQRHTASR